MGMTIDELRNYVEEQRSLNNIPYHVYSELIDGIDTLEQEPTYTSQIAQKAYEDGKKDGYVQAKLEQEPTTKNDLGVEKIVDVLGSYTDLDIPYKHKIAEDILNNLPSVTPQEPFINKPCVSSGACEHDKQKVLDKIRTEIAEEKEHAYADFERYKVEYLGQDWEDALDSLPQDDFRYGMERAIDIIDKYKAESEIEDGNDSR